MNAGLKDNLYFWRDNSGHEIDCIIDKGHTLVPLEIKSGKTISPDFFKGLRFWSKISGAEGGHMVLVYAGDMAQTRKEGHVMGWKAFGLNPLLDR